MAGVNTQGDYSPHAWVAEGYDYYKVKKTVRTYYGKEPYIRDEVTTTIVDVVYFNTGMDGKANGYFSGTVFTFKDEEGIIKGKYDDNYFMSIYK